MSKSQAPSPIEVKRLNKYKGSLLKQIRYVTKINLLNFYDRNTQTWSIRLLQINNDL